MYQAIINNEVAGEGYTASCVVRALREALRLHRAATGCLPRFQIVRKDGRALTGREECAIGRAMGTC